MATIINNPSGTTSEDSSVGMVVGLIIALVLIVLFVMYGLPALRGGSAAPASDAPGASANLNVTLPSGDTGGTTQ